MIVKIFIGIFGVEDSFDTIDANLKMVENILEAKSLDSKFICPSGKMQILHTPFFR